MTQTLPSVCPLDCPDTCSLTVTVQEQHIVKVRGSQVNPLTHGAICGKVSHYPEWVHGPDRLQTPLLRIGPKGEGAPLNWCRAEAEQAARNPSAVADAGNGPSGPAPTQSRQGQFTRLTWDEALDIIYTRFTAIQQQYGPEAILPLNYAGPHGFLAAGSMDLRFFHKLGASRLARRPLCGGVKSEAFLGTYGAVPLMRPEHVAAAQLVIVWGNNVTALGSLQPDASQVPFDMKSIPLVVPRPIGINPDMMNQDFE